MSMKSFHSRSQRTAPPRTRERAAPARPAGMQRADALLVAQRLVGSRARARELIAAGLVDSEAGPVTKPGQMLPESLRLRVLDDSALRYVSRGGLKLAAALAHSGVDVRGRICLDVGQSTGGFTDCLLQAGAAKVVGVEVGHGQLHPRLAADPRCITLEGINARHLDAADLGAQLPSEGFGLIVCDASFISLSLLMPQWPALLAADGDVLALVKPQFELGPAQLARGGVVRDAALHAAVEERIRAAVDRAGLAVCGWFDSPITGGGVGNIEGNREFLVWMRHAGTHARG
ncbi:MAG TPA: TlyA family RNA methyltransferase [Rhodocyclaceae bacterium]|nr:TlyA family RNA methyltransferase [Rhodocyclaceae bacterium]